MHIELTTMTDDLLGPERTVLFLHGITPPPGEPLDERGWDPMTWLAFQVAMAKAERQMRSAEC